MCCGFLFLEAQLTSGIKSWFPLTNVVGHEGMARACHEQQVQVGPGPLRQFLHAPGVYRHVGEEDF